MNNSNIEANQKNLGGDADQMQLGNPTDEKRDKDTSTEHDYILDDDHDNFEDVEVERIDKKHKLEFWSKLSKTKKLIAICSFLSILGATTYMLFGQNSKNTTTIITSQPQHSDAVKQFDPMTQSIAEGMHTGQYSKNTDNTLESVQTPQLAESNLDIAEPSVKDIVVPPRAEPKLQPPPLSRSHDIAAPLPPSPLEMQKSGVSIKESSIMKKIDGNDEKAEQERRAKLQSNIFVYGSGASGEQKSAKVIDTRNVDLFSNDADNAMLDSTSEKTTAKIVRNLDRTLLEGKIVDAVLESAINSSVSGGIVRAIVSRDTYSEHGKNVLIPKGSRIIGTYQSNIKAGQSRVEIVWTRLITPAGIDVQIDSKSTDALGRPGTRGLADTKWLSKLANAFLISYLIPYVSASAMNALDEQVVTSATTGSASPNPSGGGGSSTTQMNIPSAVTTTSSVKAQIAQNAMNSFQQTATQIINQHFSNETVVTVEQGQNIRVLVMKDIVFPRDAIANTQEGVLMQ